MDLILTCPLAEDSPRIAARLLSATSPFAILLPAELVPQIKTFSDIDTMDNLHAKTQECGKIFILDTDMMWLIGHIPTLTHHAEILSLLLDQPSPLLQHYSTDTTLPSTLQEWTLAQQDDPQFTADLNLDSLFSHKNLTLYRDPDFPSRIVVPTHLREKLARKIHADLHHLSAPKVLASLSRHYFWPTMTSDTRRWLADCPECDNAKAKRRLAHGLFHGKSTPGPRSRYSMDFQGQGLASTGESEALALIDSFTKTAMVLPLPNRLATTLAPALLNEVHFRRGPPTTIHSDAAPEFLSELLTSIHAITGTHRTTTLGHDPASNGELESWWRYWNRCMRFLTPAQYLLWPQFAQRICYAYNSSPHSALDQISPFEMDTGFPPLSPYAPPPITFDDNDRATEANAPPSTNDFIAVLRITTAAFHHFAKTHLEYTQKSTAERLNQYGIPTSFNVGDKVKIYVPPTAKQMDKTGRKAKHIIAWRGPCTITQALSPTTYEMIDDSSHRTFQRSLVNIRPYRASQPAPPPHHDLLSLVNITPGSIVAIKESDQDPRFRLATVLALTETNLSIHYLGTQQPDITRARFLSVWTHPNGTVALRPRRPTRQHTAYTGDILSDDLPDLLLATGLSLSSTHTLRAHSRQALHHLRDNLVIHT